MKRVRRRVIYFSQTAEQRSGPGIGYVPQDRRIFSQLTIEENLHIAMRAMDKSDPAAKSEVYELFRTLRAASDARQRPRQRRSISLLWQMRWSIARVC